jgi:hypothetical protein
VGKVIYSPPQPLIVTKDAQFPIEGASGFLIENIGTADINAGPLDQEIIPITAGQSRPFECPEGGVYDGYYAVKFGSTGTKKALIIRNIPKTLGDGEDSIHQEQYQEKIV